MTDSTAIEKDVLDSIARQTERYFVAAGMPLRPADHPELGEALAIWVLPPAGPSESWALKQARSNGRLHHQVYKGGVPVAFVHSRPDLASGGRTVSAVFESTLARCLDRAIALADLSVPDPGEARLLHVPSENVYALWLLTPGRECLIPSVDCDSTGDQALKMQIYTPDEFLAALRGGP